MGMCPGLRLPTIFKYSSRHGHQRSLGYLHHLGIMDPYSPYSHDIPMIISLKKNPKKDHVPTWGFQRFQLGVPNVISKWTNIGGETWEKNLRKRRSIKLGLEICPVWEWNSAQRIQPEKEDFYPLVVTNIAMGCHGIDGPNRNRWFTVLENGDFPWQTVSHNQIFS